MSELVLKVAASYLIGSVIGSLVVGRFLGGVDIRTLGSGNAGGTNALRTQGKVFALWVILIDMGKGWLAAGMLPTLALPGIPPASRELSEWMPVACGAAAIVGHVFPVWYGFRGGKGAATLIGVLLALGLRLLAPVVVVWLTVVILTGFVGLASILAAASLPLLVVFGEFEPTLPLTVFGAFIAVLILFTHRANLARMVAGREPRARKIWLLGLRARDKSGVS